MLQRRKSPRVEVRFPVSCRFKDKAGNRCSFIGLVHDLSLRGMRLSLALPPILDSSESVRYDLPLPHPFTPIHGRAYIRWMKWDEVHHRTTFGVEFMELKDTQNKDLKAIVGELAGEGVAWSLDFQNN
jgi:c-di-GMP-binding flagellar brake protein YcgR